MFHSPRALMALMLLCVACPSMAYMGPGAGLTAIGSLLALLAGVWYLFRGFLWLPLKRKFKKTDDKAQDQTDDVNKASPEADPNHTSQPDK